MSNTRLYSVRYEDTTRTIALCSAVVEACFKHKTTTERKKQNTFGIGKWRGCWTFFRFWLVSVLESPYEANEEVEMLMIIFAAHLGSPGLEKCSTKVRKAAGAEVFLVVGFASILGGDEVKLHKCSTWSQRCPVTWINYSCLLSSKTKKKSLERAFIAEAIKHIWTFSSTNYLHLI